MASLYEIDSKIESLIDFETGEVADVGAFESLQIEREDKIEGVALWYKNLVSDATQYKAEKMAFAEKQSQAEKKADSLKMLLDTALLGGTFKTTKVNISYRKSKAVEITDMAKISKDYLKCAEPTADKAAIKNAIESGEIIEGAELVEKQNLQIK